jgi:hypothetical protein
MSSIRYIDGTIQLSLRSARMETSLFWQKAPTLCLQARLYDVISGIWLNFSEYLVDYM